ncbi:MFS multidrug transporter [Trichophyton equinum CBS 127.97]|uniref:MFS multidrug transporter n=1 Tax=Trichophyton equinum (strain ATCC MYA-4606 / CBS 127.97) TaxID=559882 RepID=F2Q2T2_TRIEC|nr:MFS multidrug transporter [Trichophyton equinum CBS 127.97]
MANKGDADRERNYAGTRWQLVILGLFRFSEALAWTTIFPYAFTMTKTFLPADGNQAARAAVLASSTVSLFTFGEFLTAVPWAKVSDRIGRKRTLMIGVVCGAASALAFGLSRSLGVALVARAFGGLTNPNVGVVSSCVGELVKDKKDQGKAFSVVPFLRALGSLIGPVIGGWLAEPTKTIPSVFPEGSIWDKFPYLLPNMIVALSMTTSGLLGFFFLEETHPHLQNSHNVGLEMSQWLFQRTMKLLGYTDTQKYAVLSSNGDDDIPLHCTEDIESAAVEENDSNDADKDTIMAVKSSTKSAYSGQVILQILAASILGFHKVSSDVIIPIFLAQDKESVSDEKDSSLLYFITGFGMSSPMISNVLLSQAVVAILAQIFIVPKFIACLGPLKVFRWAVFAFPCLYCLTPFTSQFTHPLSTILILIDLWVKAILVNLGYTASSILLTNTAPLPLHLATVNGAAASMGSLARSVGAAVSGSIFHLGLQHHVIGFPFWALAIIALFGSILSRFLRDEP